MLYNYFGSKEGLYVAYVRRSGRALLQKMREAGRRPTPLPSCACGPASWHS